MGTERRAALVVAALVVVAGLLQATGMVEISVGTRSVTRQAGEPTRDREETALVRVDTGQGNSVASAGELHRAGGGPAEDDTAAAQQELLQQIARALARIEELSRENQELQRKVTSLEHEHRRVLATSQERELAVIEVLKEQVQQARADRAAMQQKLTLSQLSQLELLKEMHEVQGELSTVRRELAEERSRQAKQRAAADVLARPSESAAWQAIPGSGSRAADPFSSSELRAAAGVRQPFGSMLRGQQRDMYRELRRAELSRELQHNLELYRRVMERHRRERAGMGQSASRGDEF